MGRWRSGAPLVLAPEKDDPSLADDPQRNNNFNYAKMDPQGYAVPLGAHIRRMNPRDTAVNIQRRKIIRRGATYGPPLPEGAPEDGVDRGIAAFVICASLVRQFEFVQNVWVNDPNFHELGNERDPMIGAQDGTLRLYDSEAANPTKDKGPARFHDRKGRRLLLPSGYQGASLPRRSRRLDSMPRQRPERSRIKMRRPGISMCPCRHLKSIVALKSRIISHLSMI